MVLDEGGKTGDSCIETGNFGIIDLMLSFFLIINF